MMRSVARAQMFRRPVYDGRGALVLDRRRILGVVPFDTRVRIPVRNVAVDEVVVLLVADRGMGARDQPLVRLAPPVASGPLA